MLNFLKSLVSPRRNTVPRVKALAGPKYRVVQGPDETQRERGIAERTGEDGILDAYARGRLLDLTRNAVRNSSTMAAILRTFDLQVVGTKGGKAIFAFDDAHASTSRALLSRFADWTRNADFFDGFSFNRLLKILLKSALVGGDCVIVYDDGLIEDSGRLVIFESDEIGSTTDEAIAEHYGRGAVQSQGKVYSRNGRWIGTVVSRACRGETVFAPEKCFFLRRDPDAGKLDSLWIQPSNVWRPAQGRGVTPASPAIGTILDLEDLCGFELAAAKKNAQTFSWITSDREEEEAPQAPSAFGPGADIGNLTDEEIEELAAQEAQPAEQVVSLNHARSAGVVTEALPPGYRAEAVDTKHPNDRMQDFVRWLAGRSSAVFGLSEQFATLMPTGSDFRAQQLLTQPAFAEAQKWLEGICDWTLFRFVRREIRRGELLESDLPQNWLRHVSWSWPSLDELDESAHQNAFSSKLRNLTGTLREELGTDWREKLTQYKSELEYCRANGIPHPALETVCGAERSEGGRIDENTTTRE